MSKFFKKIFMTISAAAASISTAAAISAMADWQNIGFMGDLNNDKLVSVSDMVIMTKYLLGEGFLTAENGYDTKGKKISVNGNEVFLSEDHLVTADINCDGRTDVYDLALMRKQLISNASFVVREWIDGIETTTATAPSAASTVTTAASPQKKFISPPIYDLYGSMPSQNRSEMAVFYVDFPDCRYSYDPSVQEIENVIFGAENSSDKNYPFESMSAFFDRSSKGAMELGGKVFRYTTKNKKSYYENDVWHVSLIDEIIGEFDSSVDFSQFDGDKDGVVDSILVSVPSAAGDENWWAAAGTFGGDSRKRADGMDIGHVIVGNSEIASATDHKDFNSSYIHEIGHCMGLPDYYLYDTEDFQGMHGSAGFEMMDDAICDFGAASKLMLGWYTDDQLNIFSKGETSRSFILNDAQSLSGNCVVIPCGDIDEKYRSEFLIVEYATKNFNNESLKNEEWRATGSGIRVYHVDASENGDLWYNTFKYASGNDESDGGVNGRRFIRLVGEGDDYTDNLFKTSDVINSSVPGFSWYDVHGSQSIDTGITVDVEFCDGNICKITVTR